MWTRAWWTVGALAIRADLRGCESSISSPVSSSSSSSSESDDGGSTALRGAGSSTTGIRRFRGTIGGESGCSVGVVSGSTFIDSIFCLSSSIVEFIRGSSSFGENSRTVSISGFSKITSREYETLLDWFRTMQFVVCSTKPSSLPGM